MFAEMTMATAGGSGVDCLTGTVAAGSTETVTIDRPAKVIVTSDRVTGGGGLTMWSSEHKLNGSYNHALVGLDNSTTPYFVTIGQGNTRISSLSADFKTIGIYSFPSSQGTDYWIYY